VERRVAIVTNAYLVLGSDVTPTIQQGLRRSDIAREMQRSVVLRISIDTLASEVEQELHCNGCGGFTRSGQRQVPSVTVLCQVGTSK